MHDALPTCPRCRAAIPPDAHGLCPACALGAAARKAPPGVPAPGLAELAPLFPAYELLELLGRGGMGAVYRARHKKLDRLVALKVMLSPGEPDPAFAERFAREARALARLDHPGIVGVHDFGEVAGRCYLVMDHVDGANLRELMQQGRLGRGDVLRIVPQLCLALQYAHEHGIVHRDIKPENILIDLEGRVRIADFGLAKVAADHAPPPTLTQSGSIVGTLHYMAPEQLAGAAVDHRADLYALGVVLYEMLTGELPIGRFAPPSKKGVADPRLDRVVLKALDAEPQARYQAARDLGRDLTGGKPPPAADAAPSPPPPPLPQSPQQWLEAGLLLPLGLCLLATGLVYLRTPYAEFGVWSARANVTGLLDVPPAAIVFLLASEVVVQWLRWHGRPIGRLWSFGLLGAAFAYLLPTCFVRPPEGSVLSVGGGYPYLLALAVFLTARFVKRWVESDR